MINYYQNYWRNLLLFIAIWLTCGSAGAVTSVTLNTNELWSLGLTVGEEYVITLNNRTFVSGQWDFISLPFDASKEVLDLAFGAGNYQLQRYDSMDGNTFVFKAMETPAITGGETYLIKVTESVSNPTFENVTVTTTTEGSCGNDAVQLKANFVTKAGWDLINNHHAYKLIEGSLQKMAYMGEGTPYQSNLLAFSAYVATDNTTTPALSIESSGGSGSGEGGDDPDPTTLAGKIAARMQLTNAPTIYIDLPEIGNQTLEQYLYKNRSTGEAPYRPATIKVVATDDTTSPYYLESFEETNPLDLQIKVRGNSTADPLKRPYRLKFAKKSGSSDGKAHKHDLLGNGYSKRNWTLLANYFDRSLIRNALTYHLGQAIGMPFNPGYKFVDLVINGEYRGCYQVSDHCEVDGDRIDIDEDTGWFLEAARPDMLEEPKITAGGAEWEIKNPEFDDADQLAVFKTEVTNWLNQWGSSMETYSPSFTSAVRGWRVYSDEESFVNFYLAINLTGDYDGFMTVKAYREADGKLFLGPVWDKDLAYGNYSGDTGTKLVQDHPNGQLRNKMAALLGDPSFVAKLKAKMDALVAGGLEANLCNKVDELAALIAESRELNYEKWDITSGEYVWDSDHSSTDYQHYIDNLKEYLHTHIPFIKQHVDDTYNSVCANPTAAVYNPENWWYSTGLTMNAMVNETVQNRTLKGGQWNTFCMPFSATQSQMEEALGCSYELKVHSGMDEDGETMLFTAPESKDIVGAYPYLIKPLNDVSSMVFNGVVNSDSPNASANYNGEAVTYDNRHYFQGTLFQAANLNVETDYQFDDDVYAAGDNLQHFASTTTLGARAFIRITDGTSPQISFTPASSAPRTQLSDLPAIFIDTQDEADIQPSSGEWVAAGIEVIDAHGALKPFKQDIGLTAAGKNILQIRGRGTASWTNADKKSYRMQFGKDDKDADGSIVTSYKHYLLGNEDAEGVVKKRNWVLLANAGDKTLVRNALAKEIGDAVGLAFTPGYRFVDLVLNGTYVGTYQVTEFIEADANRVNIDEDDGLLIQMTGGDDTAVGDHVIAGEDYVKPYLTVKNPEVKAKNQAAWNAAFNSDVYDFDAMWAATNGSGLDIPSLVNWYIASEVIGSYEAFSSVYAYKNVSTTRLSFGPLWNNETAYDNNAAISLTPTGLMGDSETAGSYEGLMAYASKTSAWAEKLKTLWTMPWFANAVQTRWQALYNNGALTTTLTGKVDALVAIVNSTNSSQALNFKPSADGGAGWTVAGQGITEYSKNIAANTTYAEEVQRLKDYLTARLPYLNAKFAALATAAPATMGDANGDNSVNVTDIMAIGQFIMGHSPSPFIETAADTDNNGTINVNDIMKLAKTILNE